MKTQEIFEGISTSELISYQIAGDNSKELKAELIRRTEIDAKSRKGKISMLELDAKYNG
jgi:hypothetical protein